MNQHLWSHSEETGIHRILVHGKLNKILKATKKKNYREKGFVACSKMRSEEVSATDRSKNLMVQTFQGCLTENMVYGVHCGKCSRTVYVGETERQLRDRMKEHLQDVRHKKDKAIGRHFSENGHSIDDMGVFILERILNDSRYYRQIREKELERKRQMD